MKITDEMAHAGAAALSEIYSDDLTCVELACDVIRAVAPLIRSAALEEAAKVAEQWGERKALISDSAFIPSADYGERFASSGIAERIRALIDDRTPTAGDFV